MPDKYQEIEYKNFVGLDTQDPALSLSPNMLAAGSGFLIRSNALYSQPSIKYIFDNSVGTGLSIPGAPDGTPFFGIGSFVDSNNVTHTIGLTATNCYQLAFSGTAFSWSLIGTVANAVNAQYALKAFANKFYFTNDNTLYFVDGLTGTNVQTATTVCGGKYIAALANSIILAYTVESSSFYPQRIRWSAPNQFTQWDPSSNIGAGFNDLDDLSDGITGLAVIGTNAYIWSPNDITIMSPTGNNQLPFTFDHLWYSPYGVGNIFPQALDSYGATAGFVANDGIYLLTVSGLQNIGQPIIDSFFDSVFNPSNSNLVLKTNVFGRFLPLYMNNSTLRTNLMYNLYVSKAYTNGTYDTTVYSYNMISKGWSVFYKNNYQLTCRPSIISVG